MEHDYRLQTSEDGEKVRMACKCGKKSRWGFTSDAQRAQDRHADEVARG